MYKQENHFNNHCNVDPINFLKLVGGNNQEWRQVLKKIGQNHVECLPHVGDIMRNLAYELKHIKRTEFPIFLDPKTASFMDVAVHAKIRQYLADSTIEKNLRYARFMENHPMPIDFRNLTPESFWRHVDYRLEMENPPATPLQRSNMFISLIA